MAKCSFSPLATTRPRRGSLRNSYEFFSAMSPMMGSFQIWFWYALTQQMMAAIRKPRPTNISIRNMINPTPEAATLPAALLVAAPPTASVSVVLDS